MNESPLAVGASAQPPTTPCGSLLDTPRRGRGRRKSASPPAYDPIRVASLARAGYSERSIARDQGCDPALIHRFLARKGSEIRALARFKEDRADVLAALQAQCAELQQVLVEELRRRGREGMLAAAKVSEISGLLAVLNATHGTLFDKERLVRGQSTENVSVYSRMLDARATTLYARKDKSLFFKKKTCGNPVDKDGTGNVREEADESHSLARSVTSADAGSALEPSAPDSLGP